LHEGLHEAEPGTSARWTNGVCALPASLFQKAQSDASCQLTMSATTLHHYARAADTAKSPNRAA
jgi:hypothetical protein